jgi:hypothetical protein
MKKSLYREEQIIAVLKEHQARRLKSLEDENRKLRKLLAGVGAVRRHASRGARKLPRPGSRRAFVDWAIEEKPCSQRLLLWAGRVLLEGASPCLDAMG